MIPDPRLQEAMRAHQSGDLDRAARLYGAILQSQPRNFHARYLLGFVHFQRNDFATAERMIGDAITLNPGSPDAFYNRGCALQKLNRNVEAVAAFEQALALKPDYAEAAFNRGTSLLKLSEAAKALEAFDCTLRLTPQDAEAWFNRGNALQALKRFAEARSSYERALLLNPQLAFAPGKLLYCKLQCCDWEGLEDDARRIADGLRAGRPVAGPLELALIVSSPEELLAGARIWVARECPPAPLPLWRGERYAHNKIRVAYVSADFRAHAVAYQLAEVLERHDRASFEIIGVSSGRDDGSAIRQRLRSACDEFLDIASTGDAETAALLRAREIDIAVDLTGHTADSRIGILAHRPAPLQVNFLGFPGSSGAPYIDYIIGDPHIVPDEHRGAYSEAVVHLPDTYFPTDARRQAAAVEPSRAQTGLPESGFVFCSFNATCKFSPAMFRLWLRLLAAVPASVLWLPDPGTEGREMLRREMRAHSVAFERLIFAPFVPDAETHLARLPLADLFLDTLPYNAHATACDALWMGLPVLTCTGGAFAGRVAASLLHAIGMPELITTSIEAYESRARELASNPTVFADVRKRLEAKRGNAPLFNTVRYTRHLEAAYTTMVERHRRGDAPGHFRVESLG
jgi:protein O-GlcNAc transferase